ncbi:MAG: pyruvate carboxylase subunit B [Thermodesulfobacteriota bacterium]
MSDHHSVKMTAMNYAPDRPKAENPLKIMDLSLRDGHQSLFATRGRTEDMIPVAGLMDEVGFWAVEMWGGATFDTMHRFLNEDPWERIRTLKRYFKKTPFSMLLRGQNLVGYRNYADDVARAFVERAAENGMDIFRTFDALNDFRNFETVVSVIKKCGKHFQGTICYSLTEPRLGGPVYNVDYFVSKAKELESMGADTICIKDMAGLVAPYDIYNIVKALKETVKPPIHFHSHFTSGLAPMAHLKAVEAGVDILDTCLSPYAYRTSHPAVEPMVMALLGTSRDTGFDIKKLVEIDDILEQKVMPKYKQFLNEPTMSVIDINVLLHQTPGGMLSNLFGQLKEMDALDRLPDVYKELPKVRKDLGQIPLVTPTSQIVGVQTVNNVLFDKDGQRYTRITDQVKDLCYGLYGKTAVPIDPEVQKKALAGYPRGETPFTGRPAEIIDPELDKAKKEIGDTAVDIDDLILYAIYPVTGKKFLRWKYGLEEPPASVRAKSLEKAKAEEALVAKAKAGKVVEKTDKHDIPAKSESFRTFHVFVDNEYFEVGVDESGDSPVISYIQQAAARLGSAPVQPMFAAPHAAPAPAAPAAPASPAPAAEAPAQITVPASTPAPADGTPLTAPMPGMIVKYLKKVGDSVAEGETVVILEAMKMENALPAPKGGTITAINFGSGDSVPKDAVLCVIS